MTADDRADVAGLDRDARRRARGALAQRLGWALDDVPRIAAGTLVGHLLECAGQLTGGYFADPGYQDVPDLANLGFPYADVSADRTPTSEHHRPGRISNAGRDPGCADRDSRP